ncbi:dihydroorotate dehydrogenase [Candidatus Woesearchaeota archaeon]|nr:dihydroorotate dehydrogenase [Candidatus Woesearchaeota archaeon]
MHNIELENPTVLASGIMGVTPSSLKFCEQNGAGALTTKSIGLEPRKGHPNPTVIEFPAGIINAVGLSNPGARAGAGEIVEARARCSVPVFASIFGRTVDEYGEVARIIGEAGPHMVEVNVSCPNVESEFGRMFCMDLVALQKVTQIVKDNVHCPVFVKLSPNVPDIKNAAIAAVAGGADGITAINTVGPGMLIDPVSRKPVLANIVGGLSGPAIKPIAVRCVYDIRKVVDVPIIGVGGISSGNDIVEMLLAGANAVGIGSAVWYRGVDVFRTSVGELKDFMQKNGYSDVNQLVGGAHE